MWWGWGWRLGVRGSLAAIALFWVLGGVLLTVAWRSSIAEDRIRDAPLCVAGQVFTTTECRFMLDGTMTGLTNYRAEMDADGRHFAVDVTISGTIGDVAGTPVKVTFYRGRPIRVEGKQLHFDVDGTPADRYDFFRPAGLFFAGFGTFAGAASLVIALARRPGPSSPMR